MLFIYKSVYFIYFKVSLPPVLESTSGTLQVHGASKEHNISKKQRNPEEVTSIGQ